SGRRPVENTPSLTRRVLSMGLPLGLAEVMYTFANVVLMAVINGFGTDTTAAYAAYARIDAIFWMIVGSFGISITTFVGQNIGAGRWDRVMRSIRDCAVMMFVLLGGVLAVLYLFAAPLQSLFCRDPAVVAAGARMMRFLLPFYFLYIPVEIMYSALRGMGESLIPTLLTFFGVCLLRSAWGIFAVPLHRTVNMVLLGFPVTWAVTSVMFAVYFARYLRKRQQGTV
ncbi:MAG: MATE family efflux transporter, partial [Eubacteriales bacterium]|nr:MATE family efflux transporter [Eubacteriales bacterium]